MRKTWFSYLLWFLYTAAAGILLAACAAAVSITEWGLNKYMAAVAVGLFFAAVPGIWTAGRKTASYLGCRLTKDAHVLNMWECFLALCLFAASVLYRIYYLFHGEELFAEQQSVFYHMARVTSEGNVPGITHGASYLYTLVLSVVFSFLGNKLIAGVILQMVLQLMAILLLYFAIRLLAGRLTALCMGAVLVFSPAMLRDMCSLTPQGLYLVLYAFGLWLISLYLMKLLKSGFCSKAGYAVFLLLGFYIGMLVYLDMLGITLLFFAGMGMAARCEEEAGAGRKRIKAGFQFTAILVAALVAVFMLAGLDAIYSGKSIMDILWEGLEQYGSGFLLRFVVPGSDHGLAACLLVCFPASLYCVGFWSNKEQRADAFILLLLALTGASVTGTGRMDYSIFGVAGWGVLAGLGISSMGVQTGAASIESAAEVSDGDCDVPPAAPPLKESRNESSMPGDIVIEDIVEDDVQKKPPVKFIVNPLPLPKKHVKKEMSYGLDIADEQMGFDLPIDENDDFDI